MAGKSDSNIALEKLSEGLIILEKKSDEVLFYNSAAS